MVSQDVALAPPVPASGTGTRVIDLGPAPEGTTFIRVKFNCLSAGTFEMQDGSHLSCSAADVRRQQQLLGQPSHYLSQFRLPFTGLESVEVKTQSNARWSLEADYIKTVGATTVDEALLASALAANPEVRLEMTGQTASHGVVLCGTNLVGRNTAGSQLYVWLLCADFTTGPHATMLTASSEPALITVSGTGAEVRVISAQFPSQEHIDADIDRMFPPAVAARMRAGNLPTVPNQAQLLATARLLVPRRTVLGQVLSSTKVTSGFRVTLSPSKRLLAQDTFVPIPGRAPVTYLIPNSLVLDGGASLVGEIEVTVVGHRVVGLAIVGG